MKRAKKADGPFSRPAQQVNRNLLSDGVLPESAHRWVEARRLGRTTTAIARADGVSNHIVSRMTQEHGPFPAPEIVKGWADARRAGRTLAAIADDHDVSADVVRRETAKHGPYRYPGARLPEGVYGVAAIARSAGVSSATVIRWRATGRLPEPDLVTARGRPLWLPATIAAWLSRSDVLATCEYCGARCLSVGHHLAAAHS